jgi:acyl-CoA dehydrogenase
MSDTIDQHLPEEVDVPNRSRPLDYSQFSEGRHVNYWALDHTLQDEIHRIYDADEFEWGESRLAAFGEAVGYEMADNADTIDKHGPELHTYDREGNLKNEVEYHPAQFENERLMFEHGTIADSFEVPPGRNEPMPHGHSIAMEHLLSYADTGLGCPTGMTAAAAVVFEQFDATPPFEEFYEGSVARDYDDAMLAAMFLTEKQGGSDIGKTETTAQKTGDGTWRLTGEKWFCSNLDADYIFTLARLPDGEEGTAGLGMFLVPKYKPSGERNDYFFRRLKDKIGTISVPTGEVELEDTFAYLYGEPKQGFKYMTTMLNRSRLAVAAWSLGITGRALLEAKIHAANREVFGSTLDEHALMQADLVDMSVDYEGRAALLYDAADAFEGWYREADDHDTRLGRLLLPLSKFRIARQAVETTSYAMEILGGNGAISDFVTERLYRDAQIHPIWEGATNMMAFDVLRSIEKLDAHEVAFDVIDERLETIEHSALSDLRETVVTEREGLEDALTALLAADGDHQELHAKGFADYLFEVYVAALILAEAETHIEEREDGRKAVVAQRFIERHLCEQQNRGIGVDDLPIRAFDIIVRYDMVEPEKLRANEILNH